MTAPTSAAGTGDGTEVIEAVLDLHGGWDLNPRQRLECTCGADLGPYGHIHDDRSGRHRAHVAAAIRAALTPPEDQP